MRPAHALAAAREGTTAIEFTMVAAPFLALILAILQSSLIYFTQQTLETSVEAAARSIITGQTQAADSTGASGGMTQAQLQARFRNAPCASLPAYMTCSRLFIDVRSAASWSGVDTSVPTFTFHNNGNVTTQFSYNPGSQGAVVLVRLMYLWPIQGAPMRLGLATAGNGQRLIVATSVAKTESYS